MGLSEDSEQMANTGGIGRRSYKSRSSDKSSPCSSSSKASCGSLSPGGCAQTSQSIPLLELPTHSNPNPHHASPRTSRCKLCADWRKLSNREKLLEVNNRACSQPDDIRWNTATESAEIKRDAKGFLGFKFKEVKGQISGEVYTLICEVFRSGPAFGKIHRGDWILSVNGQALDITKGVTLPSVVSVNKKEPVRLIFQSPESVKCPNRCSNRNANHSRSVSQERYVSVEGPRESGEQRERRGSGKMSTDSDERDDRPRSLQERLQALADSENLSRLDVPMQRLPCLRVVISGSEAEMLAIALVGGSSNVQPSVSDISTCRRACVRKTTSGFSLCASHVDPMEWRTKLLESKLLESVVDPSNPHPSALPDRVELEVVALKSHPLSTYCQHVLDTAHSIFIVQFRCQDFFYDKQSVLLYIQRRLNRICMYASSRAPIYLVVSSEYPLPVEQLSMIGQSLHCKFAKAFMNQLQYNAITNWPCFQVMQVPRRDSSQFSRELSRQMSSDCSDSTEACQTLSSGNSGSCDISPTARSSPPTFSVNPQGRGFDADGLRDHVALVAFEQQFMAERYPFRYLLHRETVQQLKASGLHYAYKAEIMRKCSGISSEKQLQDLLRYLHSSGDILCADFLEHWGSGGTLPSKVTRSNILLDRQGLISAAKRLTVIPSRSQQQDPGFPKAPQHWELLQARSEATTAFLEYLLNDQESPILLTTLSLMNIIHCLPPAHPPSSPAYIVPFFLPPDVVHVPPDHQPFQNPYDPHMYNLCLDFHGSIPHGSFMLLLMRLLRRTFETNGRWNITGPSSADLSFANDCEMYMECNETESIVRISARCSMTYHVQDLLALISTIVDDLKSAKSGLRITVGPPCPLLPDQCAVRAGDRGKTHVIDVAGGRAPVPLWCGDRQVDQDPAVECWLVRAADVIPVGPLPSLEPVRVSLQTHIKKLPPGLFNWLCDRLNAPPVGRDWQGLADALRYTVCDVNGFKNRRQNVFDPCWSLLMDWSYRASATLEALVNILDRQLGRQDIVTDMHEKWVIVR